MTSISTKKGAEPERVAERPIISPAVDVYENDQELLLLADLPGVHADHLTIDLREDQLTLEARRSHGVEGAPLAGERSMADFHRVFTLPQGLDRAGIDAKLVAGVLELRLPKAAEHKPRQISVRSG